jgi:hypothetical protein
MRIWKPIDKDIETWIPVHGDMKTWGIRTNMETLKRGDMKTKRNETWGHGGIETWKHENMETWKHETWRHGDMET